MLQDSAPAQAHYLLAGTLIDGDGGQPLRDAVIAMVGGAITAVGVRAEFGSALEGAPVLDFADKVVMPGMIDCHAHPTLFPDRQPFDVQLQAPDEMLALTAVRQLTLHLRSGVTTLRDCAARGQTMFWVREAARRSYFPSPRLQLVGRAITHSNGHIHWTGAVADTADEIRKQVRILVAEGADAIKLVASGGGTKGGIPYLASYTVAELRVGVEAAHALERRTVAHARATTSIENCVDAGIDAIAHVEFLAPSPAYLDLNPQSSGWDTVVLLRCKQARGEPLAAHEASQLANLMAYFDAFLPVIGRLREMGLVDRMAFGSDAGPFDTEFGHMEYSVHLARLAGLSPMESLQVVTRNPARLMGLDSTIGTVRPAKQADLLVLDGDPLDDPDNLRRVAAVFKSGVRVV
jgi:imidazolonepropionase-like amidohydrolase